MRPLLKNPRWIISCRGKRNISCFTLSELLVASTLLAIIVAAISPLAMTVYRSYAVARAQAEFENEIMVAQEWIKRDMASSARREILLWPQGQTTNLQAVSFPVLRRGDQASGSPIDENDQIEWTLTVVYHMYAVGDGSHELRRTVFNPRQSDLDYGQRMAQLEDVYRNGNGDGTFNANHASTQTLLHNVEGYMINSDEGEVDAYAPGYNVVEYHALGTWVLEPGYNTYRFTVSGANQRASGRVIGIDQILTTATGLPVDAEVLPVHASVGATAVSQSMVEYSGWSNNAELYFPATDNHQYMSVRVYNDTWLESVFVDDAASLQRTEVVYCPVLEENVCRVIGRVPAWKAQVQSLKTFSQEDTTGYNRYNIRVIVSGREATLGENISYTGKRAAVKFRAADSGSRNLYIRDAYIMELDSEYNGIAGTVRRLTFPEQPGVWVYNSGQTPFIFSGYSATSNFVELEIDPEKDYLVSYYVQTAADNDRTVAWSDNENRVSTYIYQGRDEEGSPLVHNIAGEASWSDHMMEHGQLLELDRIVGVEEVLISYPETADYTSKIVNTRQVSPEYVGLNWRFAGSSNTAVNLRVRAGDEPDLSDAVDWEHSLLFTSPEGINSLSALQGQYVQWKAEFTIDSPYMQTASLRDVKLRWRGQRRTVDVAVAVGKGPDRGRFQMLVNGEAPQPAQLLMKFSLGREIDNNHYSRELSVQVNPRN